MAGPGGPGGPINESPPYPGSPEGPITPNKKIFNLTKNINQKNK
jgi:hypothetical protein